MIVLDVVESPGPTIDTDQCFCLSAGYCPHAKRNMSAYGVMECANNHGNRLTLRKMADVCPERQWMADAPQRILEPPLTLEIERPKAGIGDYLERFAVRMRAPRAKTNWTTRIRVGKAARRIRATKHRLNRFSRRGIGFITEWINPKWTDAVPDRPARLSRWKWAVGLTLAPRPRGSVPVKRSLESFLAAGWDASDVTVFAEPGSPILDVRTVWRQKRLGGYWNWGYGLKQLVEEQPDADAYVMLQDDVLYCEGLCEWLERALWPNDRDTIGFVQPYIAGRYKQFPEGDWWRYNYDLRNKEQNWIWGALCMIIPPGTAKLMAENLDRMFSIGKGPNLIDARSSRWCFKRGLDVWFPGKSLAEHMDVPSAMNHGGAKHWARHAPTFVGEGFNVNSMWE